jgi:hypothetical protein
MKLTIITPVFRFTNLEKISATIPDGVRWLCVFYSPILKEVVIPRNAECLQLNPVQSSWGVAKVNYGLNFIEDGHVYILDDDTILHPNFDIIINLSSNFDFIHFNQETSDGKFRVGGIVKPYKIDIGNFVVSRKLIGTTYLKNGKTPDGVWAEELYTKCENPIYINKTLSIYNYLR